jgi:hypothetical protein
MEGFGANINPVGHWYGGQLIPTLDRLIDDLGASLFRLDPYGFTNWIDPDSTADRSILHSDLHSETYARVYRSQPFQDAWAMARYFNSKGVRFILNVSGVVPRWMCGADGKTLVDLEAYARLLTSLAWWARNEEDLQFDLFSPFNETDLGPPEGPIVAPADAVRVLELLAERFERAGLEDLGFVAVDQGHYNLDYLQPIAASEKLREKVAAAGMHCYSDFPLTTVRDFITQNRLNWSYWLTEYGDLDQSGEREWEVALLSTRRLLRGILDGVQAAMVWDAYDNWHGHDDSWSIYGLLRTGSKRRYTPKKRYYAAKQIYRFVQPGAIRIATSGDGSCPLVAAFQMSRGDLTLVGLNEEKPLRLDIVIKESKATARMLRLFLTNRSEDCQLTCEFPFAEQFRLTIPGESIFTLTTLEPRHYPC